MRPVFVVFPFPNRNILFHRVHDEFKGLETGGAVRTAAADQDACLAHRNVSEPVQDDDTVESKRVTRFGCDSSQLGLGHGRVSFVVNGVRRGCSRLRAGCSPRDTEEPCLCPGVWIIEPRLPACEFKRLVH